MPEFPAWFKSVLNGLQDRKTKGQFREAEERLKDIAQPLSPAVSARFFTGFAEMLMGQSKTASNLIKGVHGDEIVRAAEELVKELLAEEGKPKQPPVKSNLFREMEERSK